MDGALEFTVGFEELSIGTFEHVYLREGCLELKLQLLLSFAVYGFAVNIDVLFIVGVGSQQLHR